MTNEFEIDGTKFRQRALKLKASLKAEAILVQAGLPAIIAGAKASDGIDAEAVTMLIAGLERVGELVDLFAAQSEHDRSGAWVALPPFVDSVFERRNAVLLAWLVECVTWQFADFFGGSGLALLGARVELLISRLASTGESGES